MINREEWDQLSATEQWLLFSMLQLNRYEKPNPKHYLPQIKKGKPLIEFSDEQIFAPVNTSLWQRDKGIFNTKIYGGLRRALHSLYANGPSPKLETLDDLNRILSELGITYWSEFVQIRQIGYKSVYSVLEYLKLRKELSESLLRQLETITIHNVVA